MTLTLMAGSTSLGATVFGLHEGCSDLFETDESASVLVLYKGGVESRRVPLALKPGQANEIHL
jgi:hypothetical protein